VIVEPARPAHPEGRVTGRPPAEAAGGDKRVEPLELFFDLVFVFAITQVTARLADDATWAGLGRGLLVLAAIWWAWGAYAWLTNEVDADRDDVRVAVFASMAGMLAAALAIPGALEEDAFVFAAGYFVVRFVHIALFTLGTEHMDVRMAARTLAPTALLAPLILLASTALDGTAQVALWIAALAIDFVGGGLRGIEGWRLSPGHFAERHGLIVIIALGESIVAIGVGAKDVELGLGTVAAASLGVVVAAALWATYFDGSTERVEARLHALGGRDRNTTARDAYSFLHLPMVAGIVLLALGVKKTLEHVDDPLKLVPAAALCGGVALYLVAQVAYRTRCQEPPGPRRLAAALACLALIPLATEVAALAALAALAAVCAVLLASEVAAHRTQAA
jgi:low temperature requirement protein LtrA